MGRILFKDISAVGLILMGVSAIMGAMIPSKKNTATTGNSIGNGRVVESSNGGGDTVILTMEGSRSYTATGGPFHPYDNLSATSANDLGSNTRNCGCNTGFATTATAMEADCE
jgi:hypothetical protein